MSLYLAIDGGNSKTDVVIGTDGGTVLGYVRGPGTCYQNIGLPETLTRLSTLVGRALAQARLAEGTPIPRAEIYLAGADLPAEVTLLKEAIAAKGWTATLHVDNDTFALLRAGTDAADAVAVVCGAGINCVGRTGDGRTARFASLGALSGDWGGGGQLAGLALWHAVRGEDGRGPGTTLSVTIAAHFGLSTAQEVGARIHLGELDRAGLAELTPLLFAVAAGGDEVAQRVVARQSAEIVALATVAARRLDLLDSPHSIVLGGGVLRARHTMLLDAIRSGVAAAAPKATISVVDAPPVLGAALFALDHLAADPGAHAAVRRYLSHHPPLLA